MADTRAADAPAKPWEQQPGEGPRAFEAFAVYRGMGARRSYAKVGRKLGKSLTLISRWGQRHRWLERADAWDAERDRRTLERLSKGAAAMRKAHAGVARAMLAKAAQALEGLDPEGMAPRDVTAMAEAAARLERLSRGEATGRSEASVQVSAARDPYEELTTEELRALARLAGAGDGRGA